MDIEYEATFLDINKDEMRARLKTAGAILVKPDFLQKRVVFDLPKGHEAPNTWLRVRDEQDKITMSLKIVDGGKIENQKELCLEINDFTSGIEFLQSIGCQQKAFQESRRELWKLDQVEVTIDEWPYLEPFVEVEGHSEAAVKDVSAKLGFDYSQALFCSADILYNRKYGTSFEKINHHMPMITFDGPNPFI